jgi:hypothetical protein
VAGDKKAYAEPIRKLLGVPDSYTLVSLVPAGYPADIPVIRKKIKVKLHFRTDLKVTNSTLFGRTESANSTIDIILFVADGT